MIEMNDTTTRLLHGYFVVACLQPLNVFASFIFSPTLVDGCHVYVMPLYSPATVDESSSTSLDTRCCVCAVLIRRVCDELQSKSTPPCLVPAWYRSGTGLTNTEHRSALHRDGDGGR